MNESRVSRAFELSQDREKAWVNSEPRVLRGLGAMPMVCRGPIPARMAHGNPRGFSSDLDSIGMGEIRQDRDNFHCSFCRAVSCCVFCGSVFSPQPGGGGERKESGDAMDPLGDHKNVRFHLTPEI